MQQLKPWEDVTHPDFDPLDERWTALPIATRQALATLADLLGSEAWSCTSIEAGTLDGINFDFGYTVGTDPTFLITGPLASTDAPFDTAVNAWNSAVVGVPFALPTAEAPTLAVFAPIPAGHANSMAHANVAYQFIWTNTSGLWPWQEVDTNRPVLAGEHWRPVR